MTTPSIEVPAVSVVMSVFNGAPSLPATLDSVLAQTGVALELIVIDDGSSDATSDILQSYAARDARVRLIVQDNQGLTRALIRGCAAARGPIIARQDAGDVSLPGRLARQLAHLQSNPGAVMSSCGTRFVGPGRELLYEIGQSEGELQAALLSRDDARVKGPSHHGSCMFRRDAYLAIGGYRPAFKVAQDLDLWMRLAERGDCMSMTDMLYEASLTRGSISGSRRPEQVRATRVILACAAARRSGGSDAPILAQWSANEARCSPVLRWRPRALDDARFHYFIGSVLLRRQPKQARAYFLQALRDWPWHLRSWVGLLRGGLS